MAGNTGTHVDARSRTVRRLKAADMGTRPLLMAGRTVVGDMTKCAAIWGGRRIGTVIKFAPGQPMIAWSHDEVAFGARGADARAARYFAVTRSAAGSIVSRHRVIGPKGQRVVAGLFRRWQMIAWRKREQ